MFRNARRVSSVLAVLAAAAVPAVARAHFEGPPAPAAPLQSVGSVLSLTDGVLVIEAGDGSVLTGKLVPTTRIRCNRPAMPGQARTASRRSDDVAGATGASGSQSPGMRLRRCDLAGLSVGTKILAADLSLTPDGGVWRRVGYLTSVQTPAGVTGPAGPVSARQR